MSTQYIYTQTNDCQDCYKCIRKCPVKAIKVEGQSASVLQDACIYCGNCIRTCPVEAKKVKDDISLVRFFIQQKKEVYASIAPAFRAELSTYTQEQLVAALKKLGFAGVSETAIGAELFSEHVGSYLHNKPNGVYISPCCPATVELIKKYYPQHTTKILPIDTPMLAHGKYLREQYGDDIKTVFIGPCVAKKKEAEKNDGAIDAVITFKQLQKWFAEEEITIADSTHSDTNFCPFPASKGQLFPLEGGLAECMQPDKLNQQISHISFSGTSRLLPILNDLDQVSSTNQLLLELMACDGGCINGPGNSDTSSLVLKALRLRRNVATFEQSETLQLKQSLENNYAYITPLERHTYTESQVTETLLLVGKRYSKDELNCGGCGYESCRDFAKAILSEKAERKMCVSYMRRVAQDKATVLLQRMPYGVVIVDKHLQIVESNRNFALLISDEATLKYDTNQGLEGENLHDILPYAFYFDNMLSAGVTSLDKDIKTDTKFLHLSIFSLHGNHLLCAILRNLSAPELKREEIVDRSRKVIRENLKTVQKIAFYLGENASNMETLLNSIVNIQNEND